jgi:hypothetical protein
MMLRFFRPDDPEHRLAVEALPWLVNGTLEGAELKQVERHVAECVRCRRELNSLRIFQAAVASDERDPALVDSLARLRGRLDELESGHRKRVWRLLSRGWSESQPWVKALVAAQALLLIGLAGALTNRTVQHAEPGAPLYRTLGDAATPTRGDGLVVVFRGETSVSHVNGALLQIKGRVVSGPNTAGAYTIEVPTGDRLRALELLRGDTAVVFAEPTPGAAAK